MKQVYTRSNSKNKNKNNNRIKHNTYWYQGDMYLYSLKQKMRWSFRSFFCLLLSRVRNVAFWREVKFKCYTFLFLKGFLFLKVARHYVKDWELLLPMESRVLFPFGFPLHKEELQQYVSASVACDSTKHNWND